MRLSNKSKEPYFNFIHTALNILLVTGIGLFIFEKFSLQIFGIEEIFLILIPVLFLLVFYLRGRQIFEYDSDGEALSIKNKHIIPYFFPPVSDEFPKYKLQSYNIIDAFILKRLFIKISSKKSSSLILKYDISTLTKRELGDLKYSLSRVINSNRKSEELKSQEI